MYVYFSLTQNCNLACNHCYMEAGPGKRDTTMGLDDFTKAIGNMPETRLELEITGGEVFTLGKRFYDYLAIIRDSGKPIEVEVQTNGFWAKSLPAMNRILDRLVDFDVKKLDITSSDSYHTEQGIEKNWLRRLRVAANRRKISAEIRGANFSEVWPVGRGKFLGLDNYMDAGDDMCYYHLKGDSCLTIGEDGSVYPCCFRYFPLGNVIEEPLLDIIERVREEPRFKALTDDGLRGLAVYDGWDMEEVDEIINTEFECGFCIMHLHGDS